MNVHLYKGTLSSQAAFARTVCSIAMVFSVTACASLGTHVVDMDVDASLSVRSAPNGAWTPIAGENVKSRDSRSVALVPSTTFRSKLLDWRILMSPHSMGYFIKSNVPGKLCLRFDEARISSNMHDGELPFQVTYVEHGSGPTIRNTSGILPEMKPAFSAPPLCFAEGENTKFGFILPVTKLFPSGKLFNLNWDGNSIILLDKGIGNSLRMRVPIEYDGKREELEITLKLKDARARLIYL